MVFWAFFVCWMIALDALGGPPDNPAAGSGSISLQAASAIAATAGPGPATPAAPCPDPLAAVKAFYDANDAGQFDASLAFLTDDATLPSWSEGVNGYHMRERHLTGKAEIRKALGDPGLRRTTGRPEDPVYKETEAQTSGDSVRFTLRTDRLRPNGKPYHPYQMDVRFAGCKIRALTVIELVTWL
jgi:hypothetical protein